MMLATGLVGLFFFFNDTATTEIYTLSLHDALPISVHAPGPIWLHIHDLCRINFSLHLCHLRYSTAGDPKPVSEQSLSHNHQAPTHLSVSQCRFLSFKIAR